MFAPFCLWLLVAHTQLEWGRFIIRKKIVWFATAFGPCVPANGVWEKHSKQTTIELDVFFTENKRENEQWRQRRKREREKKLVKSYYGRSLQEVEQKKTTISSYGNNCEQSVYPWSQRKQKSDFSRQFSYTFNFIWRRSHFRWIRNRSARRRVFTFFPRLVSLLRRRSAFGSHNISRDMELNRLQQETKWNSQKIAIV